MGTLGGSGGNRPVDRASDIGEQAEVVASRFSIALRAAVSLQSVYGEARRSVSRS